MAKCHDCKWSRVNDFDFEHYNRVGCVWHLENNYPATFGENLYPRVANDDLAEICEVYETRVAEQRDAPVRAEQKCPTCNGLCHIAGSGTVVSVCPSCNGTGISNRSAGG